MWSSWHCLRTRHNYCHILLLVIRISRLTYLLWQFLSAERDPIFSSRIQGRDGKRVVLELELARVEIILSIMHEGYPLSHFS